MSFRFSQQVNLRHRFSADGALPFVVREIVRVVLVVFAVSILCGKVRALGQPTVVPLIGTSYANDGDGDGIEDQLRARCAAAAVQTAIGAGPLRAFALSQLSTTVEIELIFKEQITQTQIAAFQNLGGEITHIYKAISYGWNGRLPLHRLPEVVVAVGGSLVLIEEVKVAQAHLDTATRTARVRPVWTPGFAGNVNGFDGDTNITIAVIDSGMDANHLDLAGRGVFWKDYTTDASPTPQDFSQHATHIGSIALGTGVSGGAATGTLSGTLIGTLSGIFNGNFVTTAFDFPTNPITFTATAIWSGGGSTTLQLMSHTKGSKVGWVVDGTTISGTSPLSLTTSVTGVAGKAYSPVLVSNGSITDYAIRFQIPQYPGGDGFNRMRGVAPDCNWAAAKVFANNGNSLLSWTTAAIDDLVAGRTTNNVKVMNLSLGTTGSPGISTSTRQKVNTAVNHGIFVVCSGGNDGLFSPATARETDDPGRAALALTVVASSDLNQLTDYSSQGFGSPSAVAGQEEDYKPDLMAPGGSSFQTALLAADSGSGDRVAFADQQANDHWATQGTSFAAPFAAGAGALVIEALQQSGTNWNFNSPQHPMLVKMILCATASESNQNREGNLNNPTLQRASNGTNGFPAGKDQFEGYGMINADAAVEAVAQSLSLGTNSSSLGPNATDRRVWARQVNLNAGEKLAVHLAVPTGADYDVYLYSFTPGLYGKPVILASSTLLGPSVDESLGYESPTNTAAFLVVKRIFGSGNFDLVAEVPPQVSFSATQTNGPAPLLVSFTNASVGAQSYLWNFGDGGSSTAANPTHAYTNAGIYSVSLTASNVAGTNILTRANFVVVPPGGELALTNPTLVGTNFQFTFPTVSGFTYLVQFKNALDEVTWQPWQTLSGDGLLKMVEVPVAGQPERYFRLRVE
jgi:PKD repeat protein